MGERKFGVICGDGGREWRKLHLVACCRAGDKTAGLSFKEWRYRWKSAVSQPVSLAGVLLCGHLCCILPFQWEHHGMVDIKVKGTVWSHLGIATGHSLNIIEIAAKHREWISVIPLRLGYTQMCYLKKGSELKANLLVIFSYWYLLIMPSPSEAHCCTVCTLHKFSEWITNPQQNSRFRLQKMK